METNMSAAAQIILRPAHREDVAAIIAMLADDHLGRARERLEDPLPQVYCDAFARLSSDPNIQLMVAEEGGKVVGCLQLCIMPGLSSQGASRGLIEASALPPIAAAAASANSSCNGPSARQGRGAASWSNCSRIIRASMRSDFMSGSVLRGAMSG
jgi:hypothetical protein